MVDGLLKLFLVVVAFAALWFVTSHFEKWYQDWREGE